MCGIAGVLELTGHDLSASLHPDQVRELAQGMIETLVHRGPNGTRIMQGPGWTAAHARLSVIDLEGGWQPLSAAGSTIIGNGEIYNFVELTEEFDLAGQLSTGSDFEPILHLYARMGPEAFGLLRGMYAFCFIGHDGRCWLVRDPFGIKPLSIRPYPGGQIAFASEPRAFMADSVSRPEVRAEAISDLLALNYVTPSGLEGGSAWSGFDLVLPGQIKGYAPESAGRLLLLDPVPPVTDESSALHRLDQVLDDAVKVHQRSDVPYGLFLSGGIDSATIATLMARQNTRPVTAWTCGFDVETARDERSAAERLATFLGLDWHETLFDEEDFWKIAPQVAALFDQPTCDYAILPTYKLAEAARQSLTVVLSGEGGDELFAGYGRYRRAMRPSWLGGRPAEPQIAAGFLKDKGAAALKRWRDCASAAHRPDMTRLQNAQLADISTWLPSDLLLKLDRCLMAHGLEGRTPFLDRHVASFAFSLPDSLKIHGRYGKWLLRKWLERHCPAAEPWARKKGFTVPVEAWIAPRSADMGPPIAATSLIRNLCDGDAVRTVFTDERYSAHRWPLMFTALWTLIHVEGCHPADALRLIAGEF